MTTPGRVPPASVPLEFIRNDRTGRVHIAQYAPRFREPGWTEEPEEPLSFAEGLAMMFTTPRVMLCGVRLLLTGHITAAPVNGGDFADEALCIPCVQALGDQQWRAFHVDERGGG